MMYLIGRHCMDQRWTENIAVFCFNDTSYQYTEHWRRQLWGTEARAPLDLNNLFSFSVYLTYTKSDRDYMLIVAQCKHPVTFVPLLAPNPGDATDTEY